MSYMFYGCSSLTSINLSNFNTSQVKSINNMFDGCVNLEYINLKNFLELKLSDNISEYSNMFNNIKDNIVICINEENNRFKIFPQIKNKTHYILDCSYDWKSIQRNKIDDRDKKEISDKNDNKKDINFYKNKDNITLIYFPKDYNNSHSLKIFNIIKFNRKKVI